jgi:hypothetical protein
VQPAVSQRLPICGDGGGGVSYKRWCPADAPPPAESPQSPPRCYFPALWGELDTFDRAFDLSHPFTLTADGRLEESYVWSVNLLGAWERRGPVARDAWWEGCGNKEGSRASRQQLSCFETKGRVRLRKPLIILIPSVPHPVTSEMEFFDSAIVVELMGRGRGRRVVIFSDQLSGEVLLGFVYTLGQGAKRMQPKAWLRLEVKLNCKAYGPHNAELVDSVVSLAPVCEELVLGGRDGVERVYVNSAHTTDEGGFLFESLALTGLRRAAMQSLSELQLSSVPR